MSQFGDFETAVLSKVTTAVPTATTQQGGNRALAQIPAGKLPRAISFDPGEDVERLPHRQFTKTRTVNVVLVDKSTGEAMNTKLDAIVAEFESDPTLAGVVENAWVSTRERRDLPDGQTVLGVFEVTAEAIG